MCSKGSFEEGPINKAKVKEMKVKEEEEEEYGGVGIRTLDPRTVSRVWNHDATEP